LTFVNDVLLGPTHASLDAGAGNGFCFEA